MKSIFSRLTTLSLRFRVVTLALVVLVSIAGIIAVTQLKQELIPSVEFPQTIILGEAAGMTSDQVLTVITKRMESALATIPQIVNIESTTTGAFGAVITARNNFGDNQARLRSQIQAALDQVWLPVRKIAPPNGEDSQAFARRLLGDMTPDVLIYIAERNPDFLFQLSPDVWQALPPDTVKTLLAYLAGKTQANAGQQSALHQLVEQQIVPALESLPDVANVSVSGGQVLPGEGQTVPVAQTTANNAPSLLLQLTPSVWQIAQAKAGIAGPLDASAVAQFHSITVTIPTAPPALPKSWQMDRFKDASDLLEMATLTRTVGAVFNDFVTNGQIVGALGQTDDLTPDVIKQMLAIDPTMVNYFKAEQLAAMPADVFAALPTDYIAGLDGLTRDQLAAKGLANSLTGKDATPVPVDLPAAWKINPPQLISFSFDDIPLANYSISGTAGAAVSEPSNNVSDPQVAQATAEPTAEVQATQQAIPQGPALPPQFRLLGSFFGVTLDTADDLLTIQLPASAAQQLGTTHPSAAQLINTLTLLQNPQALAQLPAAARFAIGAINIGNVIQSISPDAMSFIQKYDPSFFPSLSPDVYNLLSDDVLALPNAAPPLDTVWNNLANQPQFVSEPLHSAKDILTLGDGKASTVLNNIDKDVPQQFSGYEVRLFNSVSTGTMRYFVAHEPDFFKNLDPDVLKKLSPDALKLIPDDVMSALPADTSAQLKAIASGSQPSAAAQLASRYATNTPAADPNAPPLNADWQTIGNFLSIELNSADDLFRFFPDTAQFLNSIFDSAQGASFAPKLFGGLTLDDINYMVKRDPTILNKLNIQALQLLQPSVVTGLPTDVQDRIKSGTAPFVPTDEVTRLNGNPSLVLTIYKTKDSNNVEAFHIVDDALRKMAASNPSISVNVAFEQASFVEESISGVAREGGLGAVFAVIVILIFLSSGSWASQPRRIVGTIMVALFLVLLALYVFANMPPSGDLGQAFATSNVIVRVLLIMGVLAGLGILLYPGKLPYPSWRSTLVTAVSIPLSVLMAMMLMRWLPSVVHNALAGSADSSPIIAFLLQLFPESITLNIMTLSGLTVAIGRVVDDSIVVLENIFRYVHEGGDKRTAIIMGTRDVCVAIFAATVITVVVFLPLGLTGGLIGEFFLPFGLAVTYALLSSFIVAITVVPVLAYLLLDVREIGDEHESWLERTYHPALHWALDQSAHRWIVLGIAALSLIIGGVLFATRPQAFLPSFGQPQITVTVNLPSSTKMPDTNKLVTQFEAWAKANLPHDEIGVTQTTIGGSGGLESLILGSSSISENAAQIAIAVNDQTQLDALTEKVRAQAEQIFGRENVSVSGGTLSDQGFGGFELVLTGPQDELEKLNPDVISTLDGVPGLTNVTSTLSQASQAGGVTYNRIDQQSALSFSGELETQDTLGVTAKAEDAIRAMPNLPSDVKVSEGFQSAQQTEGFASLGKAMVIAIVIVIVILIITFRSLVHWLDIILSIIVAPVGAAVLLTLTNRVLGISALIGLLMLIGIVVTNAVVLIDRVQSNQRERGMNTHDALIEAGNRRLRPILMTALATICALIPLAIGLSEGAIIASELGTVVIGGLFSSTLLTLLVVPVAYSLLDPLNKRLNGHKDQP